MPFVYGQRAPSRAHAATRPRTCSPASTASRTTSTSMSRPSASDPQDDMVSYLGEVHYEALDRKLTDLEIAGIVHAMIIGGLETTQYALEEQAQLLCEHPRHLRAPAATERTKVRDFVEETMRMRSPTHGLSTRMTAHDEVFQGVRGSGRFTPAPALRRRQRRRGRAFACPFDLDLDREAHDPARDVLGGAASLSRRQHCRDCRTADRLGRAPRPPRVPSSTATTTTGCTSPASCWGRCG